MNFIPLTMMTQDKTDGIVFYVHVDEIRVISPHELRKEAIPDLTKGESEPRHGSLIKLSHGWQSVAEQPDQILELIEIVTLGLDLDVPEDAEQTDKQDR